MDIDWETTEKENLYDTQFSSKDTNHCKADFLRAQLGGNERQHVQHGGRNGLKLVWERSSHLVFVVEVALLCGSFVSFCTFPRPG